MGAETKAAAATAQGGSGREVKVVVRNEVEDPFNGGVEAEGDGKGEGFSKALVEDVAVRAAWSGRQEDAVVTRICIRVGAWLANILLFFPCVELPVLCCK